MAKPEHIEGSLLNQGGGRQRGFKRRRMLATAGRFLAVVAGLSRPVWTAKPVRLSSRPFLLAPRPPLVLAMPSRYLPRRVSGAFEQKCFYQDVAFLADNVSFLSVAPPAEAWRAVFRQRQMVATHRKSAWVLDTWGALC